MGLRPSLGTCGVIDCLSSHLSTVRLRPSSDIFLMESVVEFWDHGASARDAVVMALDATGNIICLAGVIMTLAFGSLLIGVSPTLNQIGYLLIVGVLIDCFITTKVIIPCAMALLPGDANFWPRKRLPFPSVGRVPITARAGVQAITSRNQAHQQIPEELSDTWEAAD